MNILVCPDSFKESLSANHAGKHITTGILHALPDVVCKTIPMSDGGEGMVEAVLAALGGRMAGTSVKDPLMRVINASYGILSDKKTAIIEMAAASGIGLVKKEERNPMIASSYGTGELIRSALDQGCEKIILGIGGSATLDAGIGMAQALGAIFSDHQGREVKTGGKALERIVHINLTGLDPRLRKSTITVCCDVSNPLTGKQGAAYVYGPQKGATPRMIKTLDVSLRHIAEVIRNQLHRNIENISGAGAAGGLGAGLMAFLNARLEPGFSLIAKLTNLETWIEWADLVITGEGRIDTQTAFGKTPAGIAALARHYKKPVIAFTGYLDEDWNSKHDPGFTALVPITDKPMTMKHSMKEAGKLLENAAERAMRIMLLGRRIF